VLDVAATDVEQPSNRVEHGEERGVGLLLAEQLLHVAKLVLRAAACELDAMRHDWNRRRLGSVVPGRVDRVGLDRHELDTGFAQDLAEALDLLDRVQRWVVADACAPDELFDQPGRGFGLWRLHHLEQGGIGLRPRLQDVAAVDEQCGRLVKHDRNASRSGKAGEPSQSLGRRRQELVLVLVAMGN